MTEQDYVKATNRAKVSAAITILRDVLTDSKYGITLDEYRAFMEPLLEAQDKLFASYKIEGDN